MAAAVVLAAGITLAVRVAAAGPYAVGLLRADALSVFMLIVIGAVGLLATGGHSGLSAWRDHRRPGHRAHGARHSVLVGLFLAAMALAVLAANLGVLWVAIEATTIVTASWSGSAAARPPSKPRGSTW